MSHSPEDSLYLGPGPGGSLTFTVESASMAGYWYTTTIFSDGRGGLCTCPGFRTHGHCTMVDRAADLLALAQRLALIDQLLDLSAGINYNISQEGDYELDEPTLQRADALLQQADQFLGDELGGGGLGQ